MPLVRLSLYRKEEIQYVRRKKEEKGKGEKLP